MSPLSSVRRLCHARQQKLWSSRPRFAPEPQLAKANWADWGQGANSLSRLWWITNNCSAHVCSCCQGAPSATISTACRRMGPASSPVMWDLWIAILFISYTAWATLHQALFQRCLQVVFWPQNLPARAVGLGTGTRLTQESVTVYATTSWTMNLLQWLRNIFSQSETHHNLFGDWKTPWLRTPPNSHIWLDPAMRRALQTFETSSTSTISKDQTIFWVTVTNLNHFPAGNKAWRWAQATMNIYSLFFFHSLLWGRLALLLQVSDVGPQPPHPSVTEHTS